MVLMATVLGLNTYVRSFFNLLDSAVVLVSWLSLGLDADELGALRALRALRALKVYIVKVYL